LIENMATSTKSNASYHHGDLRRALTDAAVEHVRSCGHDTLSLRELARGAGVTVGAVYKHFADRDALLMVTALEGFNRLAEATARQTARKTGREKVLGVGRAYVAFASGDPLLFRLMFSRIGMQVARDPLTPQTGAFQQLRSALAEVHGISESKVPQDLLALTWSVAHGAASLVADGVWKPGDPRAEAALRRLATLIAP
jgi:AcrR family transcriptional regulator